MGMKSYIVGKTFEEEILNYYNKMDYFTYKIPTQINGTVFDIIAIKNGQCLTIECKHVEGDKLNFKSSGLAKKKDELDHFISTCNTNVYIYVKSDKLGGIYWTTWKKSGKLLEDRGYLKLAKDCFKADLSTSDKYANNKTHGHFKVR